VRLVEADPSIHHTGTDLPAKKISIFKAHPPVRPHVRLIILADESTPPDVVAAFENGVQLFLYPILDCLIRRDGASASTAPIWDDGIEIVSATPEGSASSPAATRRLLIGWSVFQEISDLPLSRKEDVATASEMLLNAIEHGVISSKPIC